MPNLTRLSERAIVYHNHYAGSNFTTSGTASLLTGTLPWTHRALQGASPVVPSVAEHNVFRALDDYYRFGSAQNDWAEVFLRQFSRSIDELIPRQRLNLANEWFSPVPLLPGDDDTATVAWIRDMRRDDGYAYSLFLSDLVSSAREKLLARYKPMFPKGLPLGSDSFVLENVVELLGTRLRKIPQPFFSYLHFLPPHAPYRTSREFAKRFARDNVHPMQKPIDVFASRSRGAPKDQSRQQTEYDEFLLYVDKCFAALFHALEDAGVLDNTRLILTSDHGEMFERGIVAHAGPALYQPVIRVPLLIFEPGRRERLDIHDLTSAVDVLPTVAHLTGHDVPAWTEGAILPPFAPPDPARPVYAMRGLAGKGEFGFWAGAMVMVKGSQKLHYYFGYPMLNGSELVRLFNVQSDPEEMNDLSSVEEDTAATLLDELKAKLAQAYRSRA